jgi:hypothetical protein
VIKDRENGLLVDFFSVEQIAERVEEVLGSTKGMARVRKQARATAVGRYDLKRKALPSQLALIARLVSGSHVRVAPRCSAAC